eukprot:scaffold72023_cov31-Tisochrysis_lutea.AAC.3
MARKPAPRAAARALLATGRRNNSRRSPMNEGKQGREHNGMPAIEMSRRRPFFDTPGLLGHKANVEAGRVVRPWHLHHAQKRRLAALHIRSKRGGEGTVCAGRGSCKGKASINVVSAARLYEDIDLCHAMWPRERIGRLVRV